MSFLFLLSLSLLIIGLGTFLLLALSWNEEKKEWGLPVNLFLKEYWGRSFDFTGKTRRKDFWLALLQTFLVYFFLIGVPMTIYIFYELNNVVNDPSLLDKFSRNISFLSWFGAIINFVPGISIQIRRLRDIGKEPAWVLLTFIPFISLILLFWYAKSSFKSQFRLSSDNEQNNLSNDKSADNLENVEERLAKIKNMFERGVISNEEYQELRKKTLGL